MLGVGVASKSQELIGVLAHPGLDVVAGNVVPFDAIVVEVVENGDAGLVGAGLGELAVVGLPLAGAAGVGPVADPAEGAVGGGDTGGRAGPEPAVDERGLQVGPVAAVKVALAAGGPDVLDLAGGHGLVHELCLSLALETHQVLAMLPAGGKGFGSFPAHGDGISKLRTRHLHSINGPVLTFNFNLLFLILNHVHE